MSDRALLEAAAKAAGITDVNALFADWPHGFGHGYWNPLTRNRDAFWLASKLKFEVFFHGYGAAVSNDNATFDENNHPDDPCSGARRAIVRAAAAPGDKT